MRSAGRRGKRNCGFNPLPQPELGKILFAILLAFMAFMFQSASPTGVREDEFRPAGCAAGQGFNPLPQPELGKIRKRYTGNF